MNIQAADVVVNGISALIGGAVGGWLIAHRVGRWQQRIEDRLEAAEVRLSKGDNPIGQVPVMKTQIDVLITALRELKAEVHDGFKELVTRAECDRRHERDA